MFAVFNSKDGGMTQYALRVNKTNIDEFSKVLNESAENAKK